MTGVTHRRREPQMLMPRPASPAASPAPTVVDAEMWPLYRMLVCGWCHGEMRPWQPVLTRRFYACGCVVGPVNADAIEAAVTAAVIQRRTDELTPSAVRPEHRQRTWQRVADLHRRRFIAAALTSVTVFDGTPGDLIVAYQWCQPGQTSLQRRAW